MTKNLTKKIAVSLINNSFTENLLPFLKVRNRRIEKKSNSPLIIASNESLMGKSGSKNTNIDVYGVSFSQKIKKAENNIIKQYFRQLKTNFPPYFNSRPLFEGESKSSFFCASSEAFRNQSLRPVRKKRGGTLSFSKRVKLKQYKGYQKEPVLGKLKMPVASNMASLDKYKTNPFTVLLSIEHIRDAILSKRSVVAFGQSENIRSGRIARFQSLSEFKKQMYECRKVRLLYGNLSKKDLNISAAKAKSGHSIIAENLLLNLETRLDVTLHRCGFFPTIKAAKQWVIHKRITINNVIVDFPSYQMQAGDIIKIIYSNKNSRLLDKCLRFKAHYSNALLSAASSACEQLKLLNKVKPSQRKDNLIKDLFTAQWINDIMNKRSVQWRYASSFDMIWYLLRLQYKILLPLLINSNYNFKSKLNFLAKTFIKKYYEDRIDCTIKQNYNIYYQINQALRNTKKQVKLENACLGKQSLLTPSEKDKHFIHSSQSHFIKSKEYNWFWTQLLAESISPAYSCFSFSPHNAKSEKLQNSYWLDFYAKKIFLSWRLLKNKLSIPQNKKLSSTQSAFNNFSKTQLCLHIGRMLNTTFKTLRSIVWIITNRHTLEIKYLQNEKKRSHASDYYEYHFFFHLLFHLFCYSLLVQKKLVCLSKCAFNLESVYNHNFHFSGANKAISHQSNLEYHEKKEKSKALHLEISYASLCAIYLYPPQRIYLPAVINLDLLRKALY